MQITFYGGFWRCLSYLAAGWVR